MTEPRPTLSALYRKVPLFLGRRVVVFLIEGVVIGLSLFAIELAFAYSMQAFLVCLRIVDPRTVAMPAWLPISTLPVVLAAILVLGLLRGLLNWAQVYTQGAATEEFKHLQGTRLLRWAFHSESVSTTEALTLFGARIGSGAATINSVQGLAVQLTSGIMILGALILISPRLTAAVGVAVLLLALPMRRVDKKIYAAGLGVADATVRTNRRLITSIRNLLLIQIYGTQGIEEKAAQDSLQDYRRHSLSLLLLTGLKYAVPQFAGVVLICVITLAARDRGEMAPGLLLSYFYLLVRLLQSLATINMTFATAVRYWPDTVILLRWWETQAHDGLLAPQRRVLVLAPRAKSAQPVGWKLADLCFTYPAAPKPVIENLSLRLEPGKTLAITGPSGSGKSTLLNILLGTLLPDAGSIEALLHDGRSRPLQDYRNELLPLVGYVGPESFMLEGTLYDNLIYGLQRVPSKDEIEKALAKAECGFVRELAAGLDYTLTEQGQGLSAGQKQRLSLARALLRDPKVIILDEATSNLDNETEEKLVDTLSHLKGEMTIIAATHRKALLKIADQQMSLA